MQDPPNVIVGELDTTVHSATRMEWVTTALPSITKQEIRYSTSMAYSCIAYRIGVDDHHRRPPLQNISEIVILAYELFSHNQYIVHLRMEG